MKVYLSGMYARREEIRVYGEELEALGVETVNRWTSMPSLAPTSLMSEYTDANSREIALVDYGDVESADIVVAFTEPIDTLFVRGTRWVEFGIGLANGKTKGTHCMIVGPRENFFCHLPQVEVFEAWPTAKQRILELTLGTRQQS